MLGIYVLLIVEMGLTVKFAKDKVKIGLAVLIGLCSVYCIMFNIDMNMTKTFRKPIFAFENGMMGSMKKYTGLGYTIGIEEVTSESKIAHAELILLKWRIVDVNDDVAVIEDPINSGILMTIKDGSLTKDGVTIILKNNTDDEYVYGPDYYVEKYDDGSWKQASTLTGNPLSWNAIAYSLKANDSVELTLNFKLSYGELSDGKYRVIKRVSKEEDRPITEDKVIKLSVEFEIK